MILSLPPLSPPRPQQLIALAQQQQSQFQQIPSVDQVLEKLTQGHTNITPLEWYCCLKAKAEWDQQQSPDQQRHSATLIWRQIGQDSWLCIFLLRRLLDQCQSREQLCLAPSILDTVDTIYNQAWLGNQKDFVNLVYAVYQTLGKAVDQTTQHPVSALGPVAAQYRLNKGDYIAQLSKRLSLSWQDTNLLNLHFIEQAAIYFNHKIEHKSYQSSDEKWMTSCLNDPAVSKAELAIGITTILEAAPTNFSSTCPQLIELFIQLRWQQPELYNLLGDQAKIRLNALIGAANYTLFSELVDTLLKYSPIFQETEGSENKERNRIDMRRYFWSNYSDRFEAVKILVPPSSYQILEQANHDMNYIEKLDVSSVPAEEETEFCFFDFGNYIIAEPLRGTKDMYLFRDKVGKMLMEKPNLSLKQMGSVVSWRHDHMLLWQNFCERWLAIHKIFPNDGITKFRQDSENYHPYSRSQGMPRPSQEGIKKREEQLRRYK